MLLSDLTDEEFAQGCVFLHQVALGHFPQVFQLYQQTPELIQFRDYDRRTPLHVAASEGHLGLVLFLVEKGACLNRSDRWGGSPLDDAHRHGHLEVFEYLRQQGAHFGSPSPATAFITAASEGDVPELVRLLNASKDINALINKADYDARTALHLAAGEGHLPVVKLLCEAGANVNATDRWGNRPLDDVYNCNDMDQRNDMVEVLESFGAKKGGSLLLQAENNNDNNHALLDLMNEYGVVREGELSMDWHDVQRLLQGIGEDASDQVVRKLFSVADANGDGYINTQEFMDNHEVFLSGRPATIILVVGGPGSGKGILSQRLVQECGVVHLSSGDLLRQEVALGTPLGKQVEDIMKSGGLVSSAIMVALMQKRMKDHPGKGILLDGFPRSQENAQDLVALCGKPQLALHLDCDDTVLLERILKRGENGERADDNFHTGLQRVRNYHKYHHLTLEFLRQEHVPVVNLDCSTTPDGVWEQLRAIGRLMRPSVRLPMDGAASTGSTGPREAK